MCQYSLHARWADMRKAKVGETLTRGAYQGHAAFKGSDGMLTCIKHGSMLTINCIVFDCTAQHIVRQWQGKTVTVKFIEVNRREWGRHYAADCFVLPDGTRLHITQLADGVMATILRKVRKDKGTKKPRNLTKVLGLDQIKADIPVEKVAVIAIDPTTSE